MKDNIETVKIWFDTFEHYEAALEPFLKNGYEVHKELGFMINNSPLYDNKYFTTVLLIKNKKDEPVLFNRRGNLYAKKQCS